MTVVKAKLVPFAAVMLLVLACSVVSACSSGSAPEMEAVEDGTYSAFVENVSAVSFEGNQMVVTGAFELDGKQLQESTFELELSDDCVYEYDWGGEPSGDVSEEVQAELSNLEFGSMAFDVDQGKVTRVRTGA